MCFSVSNRQTYGKLELTANHRKQTVAPASNRQKHRVFTNLSLDFRTRPARPQSRTRLPRTPSRSKMFFSTRSGLVTHAKQSHVAGSRASKFLSGQKTPSREELTCTKQTTSQFLIGTENAFFRYCDDGAKLRSLLTSAASSFCTSAVTRSTVWSKSPRLMMPLCECV